MKSAVLRSSSISLPPSFSPPDSPNPLSSYRFWFWFWFCKWWRRLTPLFRIPMYLTRSCSSFSSVDVRSRTSPAWSKVRQFWASEILEWFCYWGCSSPPPVLLLELPVLAAPNECKFYYYYYYCYCYCYCYLWKAQGGEVSSALTRWSLPTLKSEGTGARIIRTSTFFTLKVYSGLVISFMVPLITIWLLE